MDEDSQRTALENYLYLIADRPQEPMILLSDPVLQEEIMAFNADQAAKALKEAYLPAVRRELEYRTALSQGAALLSAGRRGGKTINTYTGVIQDNDMAYMTLPRVDSWGTLRTLLNYSSLPKVNVDFIIGYIDGVTTRELMNEPTEPETVAGPPRHISFEDE